MENTVEALMRQYLPDLTEAQARRLSLYAARLKETNEQFNLTSLTSPEEIVLLHFYDSLTLLGTGLFRPKASVIDVGTGAGIPAFPIAACTDCAVTANDATEKKLKFIKTVSEEAGLTNLSVLNGRAEELGKWASHRECYDIAVSRGVARLNILCEWAVPFVRVGGHFIAMKGSSGNEELAEAENAIRTLGGKVVSAETLDIPMFERKHMLIVIRKERPTDAAYPRPNGRIKKKPL